MKLTYSKICRILLTISFIIAAGGYYLLPIDYVGEYVIKIVIAICGILLAIMSRLLAPYSVNNLLRKIDIIVILILVVSFIVMTSSVLRYGYSMRDTIINYTPFFYVLYAYPLLYICIIDKTPYEIVGWLSKIELILLIIRFITFIAYNYFGLSIFPRLLFQYNAWVRDGVQRIEASIFFGIALVYWTVLAIEGRKSRRLLYWIFVVFMILFLTFATRVRFQSAVAILVVFLVAYLIKLRATASALIIRIAIVVMILIAGFAGGVFETVYNLVSVNGIYGAQTSVRLLGFTHYLSMLKGSRALFGLGILDQNYLSVRQLMLRDQWSIFYLDDLGIIGGIAQFGSLSLFMYVPLFVLSIRTCIVCKKNSSELNYGFALGITLYMIVSCFLLNIYDRQRAFDVPMYLGILSYLYCMSEK